MVGPDLFGVGQTVEHLLQQSTALGFTLTVATANRPHEYDLREGNEAVARFRNEHRNSVVGLARLDPNRNSARADLTHAYNELGLSGLFLHPAQEYCPITAPRAIHLIELSARERKPVVVAAGFPWMSEPLQVADVALRFPETTFVMTNGGQINVSGLGQFEVLLALRQCPNIVITTTGLYRQDFIERVVSEFGAERLMFAGGSPLFEPAFEVSRIENINASPETKTTILAGVARKVFDQQREY